MALQNSSRKSASLALSAESHFLPLRRKKFVGFLLKVENLNSELVRISNSILLRYDLLRFGISLLPLSGICDKRQCFHFDDLSLQKTPMIFDTFSLTFKDPDRNQLCFLLNVAITKIHIVMTFSCVGKTDCPFKRVSTEAAPSSAFGGQIHLRALSEGWTWRFSAFPAEFPSVCSTFPAPRPY